MVFVRRDERRNSIRLVNVYNVNGSVTSVSVVAVVDECDRALRKTERVDAERIPVGIEDAVVVHANGDAVVDVEEITEGEITGETGGTEDDNEAG